MVSFFALVGCHSTGSGTFLFYYYIFIVPFITGVARSGEKYGTSPHNTVTSIPVFIAKYAQFGD